MRQTQSIMPANILPAINMSGQPAALIKWTARLEPFAINFAAPPDMSLLHAAEAAGLDGVMPSSCRNGTCRTCMCLLLEGKVSYRIEWPGLSADEKREGYILPCVAFAVSDVVIQTL